MRNSEVSRFLRPIALLVVLIGLPTVAICQVDDRNVPGSAEAPGPNQSAVSFEFFCDALVVTGTSDQEGVGANVIVRWSGFPGTTRASRSTRVRANGTFDLVVPIRPTLTNPPPAPISHPFDPDNMEQFLWIYGLDGNREITETFITEGAICDGLIAVPTVPAAGLVILALFLALFGGYMLRLRRRRLA